MAKNKILIIILRKVWTIVHSLLCVIPPNLLMERLTRKQPLDMNKYRKRPNDTAVVTGANRGVGAEIVKRLLQLEMHVIVGVRNLEQMKAVLQEIRESGILTGSLEIIHLDLDYLASVRKFANEIIMKGIPLHVLINNAGAIGDSKPKITADGIEEMLQCNALAPFLLNNLLLTQLVEGGTRECYSSIVDVSSVSQYYGKIDFEDLNSRKWFDNNQVYSNSKLIQTALNSYLGNRLRDYAVKVRANSLHPGIVGTNFFHNVSWYLGPFGALFRLLTGKPENGADEVLYIAVDPEVAHITGKYFIRHKVDPDVPALSTRVMERLWDTACQTVGIENVFKKLNSHELKFKDLNIQELDRASAAVIRSKQQRGIQALQSNPEVPVKLRVQYPETFRWEGKNMKQLFKSSSVAPTTIAATATPTEHQKNETRMTSIDIETP